MKNFASFFIAFFLILNQSKAQNNALQFDGTDDRVTGTLSTLPQGNAARTIEAWIKYTTGDDKTIFRYGVEQNNQTFALHLYNGVYIIGLFNDLSTGYAVNDGSWHHLAVTHDGTTTKVYVDGIQRGSKTTTYNTTGTDFHIGTYLRTTYQFFYNGTIDEVRVWNVARTQSEIQATMNSELSSGTGLILAYHFNETSGTTADDAIGSNDGTLTNFNFNSSSGWISGVVLPTELLDFTGKHIEVRNPATGETEGTNLLTWQTASENNSSHFDIERSPDGLSFEKIGETKAQGKGSTYNCADNAPLSMSYYRLKQMDNDGKFTYSKTISIAASKGGKIQVFPTITEGVISIRNEELGITDVSVFNAVGQLMLTQKGVNQVDLSAFSTSMYMVQVKVNGETLTQKVFKK